MRLKMTREEKIFSWQEFLMAMRALLQVKQCLESFLPYLPQS